MEKKKYVVLNSGEVKVFDKDRIHAFQVCQCSDKECENRAVSAGFCSLEDGEIKVWGQSTSIGVRSRQEDKELVAPFFEETPNH